MTGPGRYPLYGIPEIAAVLQQKTDTVRIWYYRGKLPPPSVPDCSLGLVWWPADIEPWIAAVWENGSRPPDKRKRGRGSGGERKQEVGEDLDRPSD